MKGSGDLVERLEEEGEEFGHECHGTTEDGEESTSLAAGDVYVCISAGGEEGAGKLYLRDVGVRVLLRQELEDEMREKKAGQAQVPLQPLIQSA